ncbi:TldD/PmbA family protein [Paraburkholderia phosphatilytica]|uniref:TldD/PmbA family protein n=1 Tax=Paraburkholderia phosphatilytica TaxID=2282883 RepID=UPI000E54D161|nr:metallopeptidase TldD-related protein [Paraburkholderia phosphatilytica]
MTDALQARTSGLQGWHAQFDTLAHQLERLLSASETTLLSFAAEHSDFIRFNAGKVRQIGHVSQGTLTLRLIDGQRQASSSFTVSGDAAADLRDLTDALGTLRDGLRDAADDPHLLFDTTSWQRTSTRDGRLPEPGALIRMVAECAKGFDFVGFYAGGTLARGFASSLGSRGWYEVSNFNFSWSLYDPSGRAIKTTYAGDDWRDDVFAAKLGEAAERLPILSRTPHSLKPGGYRAWIAPAALAELLSVASWNGFSARAKATSQSVLRKLYAGEVALDARVSLAESLELGITPAFNQEGYLRDSVNLVQAGRGADVLTNARSAREYGLQPNGALEQEAPVALSMQPGTLADADVLAALDTGLYIGNLWYVNVSDRMNCRLTGMTRFATFWVEGGKIVAPVEAMRFDDSLYRLLGDQLEQIGAQPELLLNDSTYGERSTGGEQLPGILVRSFELTL